MLHRFIVVSYLAQMASDTPVFSTNKTGHHDITEVLLKVALSTKNQNQPNQTYIDPLFKLLIPQGSKLGKKRTCF
jgi:hypothetical protein